MCTQVDSVVIWGRLRQIKLLGYLTTQAELKDLDLVEQLRTGMYSGWGFGGPSPPFLGKLLFIQKNSNPHPLEKFLDTPLVT